MVGSDATYAAIGGGSAGGVCPPSFGLSSGWPSSSFAGVSMPCQSAGVSGARPCAMRALSHCGLGAPNSHDAATSRHALGRRGWIVQRERTPISASRAMQRGAPCEVPFIARSCRRRGSVSSGGTVPPRAGSASDQWSATRKWAQQAPQARQG